MKHIRVRINFWGRPTYDMMFSLSGFLLFCGFQNSFAHLTIGHQQCLCSNKWFEKEELETERLRDFLTTPFCVTAKFSEYSTMKQQTFYILMFHPHSTKCTYGSARFFRTWGTAMFVQSLTYDCFD